MNKPEVPYIFIAKTSFPPDPWLIVDTDRTCRLYYIHSGSAFYRHENKELPLKPEHLYYFPPNLAFFARTDAENPVLHTYVDFIMQPPILSAQPIEVNTKENRALYHTAMTLDALLAERPLPLYQRKTESDPLVFDVLETMLAILMHSCGLAYVDDPMIIGALDIIRKSYHTHITVHEIAACLGFDTDYLIRRFRRVLGITPYAYIKSLKLKEAERLRIAGLTVEEAAVRLGYAHASSLCHAKTSEKSISDKN